mmetsp:Transcript_15443/g.27653  ORF Transcript_15443/g.27653 Transcript_15443/m.27653 type:complete len:346 (-) Transcript_15443:56-1093(-)
MSGVVGVTVWVGDLVDGVQFDYADGRSTLYGRRGGRMWPRWNVPRGEFIIKMKSRAGDSHDGCSFLTSAGTESPWYGGHGGRPQSWAADEGNHIVGLRMRAGSVTDIPSGIEQTRIPVGLRQECYVTAVTAWTGALVDAIMFEYSDGREQLFGRRAGRQRPKWTLPPGECIVGLKTRAGDSHDGCCFVTSSGRESPWFGGHGGRPQTFTAQRGNQIVGLRMRRGSITDVPAGIEERPMSSETRERQTHSETRDQQIAEDEALARALWEAENEAPSCAAEAAAAGASGPTSETDRGREECVACLDAFANACLVPCGHTVVCMQCAESVNPKRCPFCRIEFEGIIRV